MQVPGPEETTEAIAGGVSGPCPLHAPLCWPGTAPAGQLRCVGRSTVLSSRAARSVAGRLALLDGPHPWKGRTFSERWGSTELIDVVLVQPAVELVRAS
ncbi:hypothetical protein [Streptomyces sp. NPDC059278]|uniref:hypothetical protein n=1 Tax=Streptomyces sp. NPDC059278 TaxID=3346801 RepID=UPI0036BC999C